MYIYNLYPQNTKKQKSERIKCFWKKCKQEIGKMLSIERNKKPNKIVYQHRYHVMDYFVAMCVHLVSEV